MSKRDKIKGKFLFRKKSAVLIEIVDNEGNPHRYSLPADKISIEKDGSTVYVTEYDLDLAIEYGVPWEYKLEEIRVTPLQLAMALRRNGIWTAEDAMKKPDAVKGALMSSISMSISSIIRIAKDSINKEN